MKQRKQNRMWMVTLLLLAVLALAACGGGETGSADVEEGAAPNVPASDATVTAQGGDTEGDTTGGDTTGGDATGDAAGTEGDVQGEASNDSNTNSGAGDTSGANTSSENATATDLGSGSDGAQSSGGSNEAGGTTSPESDTGAPTTGDATGNAESGTGTNAQGGDTGTGTDASGAEGGTAGGAATGTGDNNAVVAGSTGMYTAVSEGECTLLQSDLTTALGVEVNRATGVASFTDLDGNEGESCQLTINGTGVQFTSVPETAQRIADVFTAAGWSADTQYAADSPTGTIGALRRENQLAAYNIDWSPADGVNCPADQPISACAETLTPEQMNYTITIDLAQQ